MRCMLNKSLRTVGLAVAMYIQQARRLQEVLQRLSIENPPKKFDNTISDEISSELSSTLRLWLTTGAVVRAHQTPTWFEKYEW